jgi:hypothetical protein
MKEVTLFKSCKGLNDSPNRNAPDINLETGETELLYCSNFTTLPDGRIETVPAYEDVVLCSGEILALHSGNELLINSQGALEKYAAGGTTVIASGGEWLDKVAFVTTPIDTRVSTFLGGRYKYVDGLLSPLTVGANPDPVTATPFYAMPYFSGGFVHGANLFSWFGKFLQYSKDYAYDLWDLGSAYIGSKSAVVNAGSIPGCIVTVHADGIAVCVGTHPSNLQKAFYPCKPVAATLYSGVVSRLLAYAHIIVCEDGIYTVTQDGKLTNATEGQFDSPTILNTEWSTALVRDGKYYAFGPSRVLEYNLKLNAVMLQSSGVTAAALHEGELFVGSDTMLQKLGTSHTRSASFTLPYCDYGYTGRKKLHSLYVSGDFSAPFTLTINSTPLSHTVRSFPALGQVRYHRLQGLSECIGNELSITLQTSGYCRVEEIKAIFVPLAGRQ